MPERKNLANQKKPMGIVKKIFILHGWAYSIEKWRSFVVLMKAKGFEPILLGIPGLTREIDRVWTIDDYVSWLNKELEAEEDVILVGHSNGGRIALTFAVKYPEKLKHLILIDSAGIYHRGLGICLKRFLFKVVAKLGKKIVKSERLKNLLYKIVGESDYLRAAPLMKQTMVNLASTDLAPSLNKIVTPTLIIWGKLDKITPLSDGRQMRRLIKGSQLCVIDEAKHSPQFTHPQEVCQKIIDEIIK